MDAARRLLSCPAFHPTHHVVVIMKNFVTAIASALLVAVIVTSLYTLVFASSQPSPLSLFFLSFLGMAAVALFNVRQAALRSGLAAAPAASVAGSTQTRSGNPKSGGAKSGSRSNSSRDPSSRGGRGRSRSDRKDKSGKDNANAASSGTPTKSAPQADAGAAATDRAPVEPAVIPDGPRETGTVKWFNRSKGFGFIIRDNGEEIFVHHRSIRNSDDTRRSNLRDGQTVNYVVADHTKGQQAEDVVGE